MRFVLADFNPQGESTIVSVQEFDDSVNLIEIPSPAELLDEVRQGSQSQPLDLRPLGVDVSPGQIIWSVFRQTSEQSIGLHHTDTVDFDVVLEGSTTLSLENGAIELHVGDCVVIKGVPHAWRAGRGGCLLSVIFLGNSRNGP